MRGPGRVGGRRGPHYGLSFLAFWNGLQHGCDGLQIQDGFHLWFSVKGFQLHQQGGFVVCENQGIVGKDHQFIGTPSDALGENSLHGIAEGLSQKTLLVVRQFRG